MRAIIDKTRRVLRKIAKHLFLFSILCLLISLAIRHLTQGVGMPYGDIWLQRILARILYLAPTAFFMGTILFIASLRGKISIILFIIIAIPISIMAKKCPYLLSVDVPFLNTNWKYNFRYENVLVEYSNPVFVSDTTIIFLKSYECYDQTFWNGGPIIHGIFDQEKLELDVNSIDINGKDEKVLFRYDLMGHNVTDFYTNYNFDCGRNGKTAIIHVNIYQGENVVFIVDLKGKSYQKIDAEGRNYKISPQGDQLAFLKDELNGRDSSYSLFLYDINSKNTKLVYRGKDKIEAIHWTGNYRLVYALDKWCTDPRKRAFHELYVYNSKTDTSDFFVKLGLVSGLIVSDDLQNIYTHRCLYKYNPKERLVMNQDIQHGRLYHYLSDGWIVKELRDHIGNSISSNGKYMTGNERRLIYIRNLETQKNYLLGRGHYWDFSSKDCPAELELKYSER